MNALATGGLCHRFEALGGPCTLHLDPHSDVDLDAAAQAAEREVRRIHDKYSRYRDDSLISRINRSAGGPGLDVDEETAGLFDYAATAFEQSEGAFDISSGVLRRVWDFRAARVPDARQIETVLPLIGWHKIRWERPRITLPVAGMEIDLGGIGKEYAADRAAARLREHGIRHALVDLAGDLHALGRHADGEPWLAGVQHPRRAGPIASIPLHQCALATSGDYERGFSAGGRRYCHILDPRTGWPARGLASVSVIAAQCLIAGTAATTAMILGPRRGPAWLRELGLPHLVIDEQLDCSGTLSAGRVSEAPEPTA